MMMRFFISILFLIILRLSVHAQPQKLYVKIPDNGNGFTSEEFSHDSIHHRMGGITDPDFFLFLPDKKISIGKIVIICPGGGYNYVAYGHEGLEPAKWLNNLGIAAVVLRYRTPNFNHKIPLNDVHKMFSVVRENASKWNINPNDVGIMGFSAGGHLASTATTKFSENTRPNFAILVYPVITMNRAFTHIGSRNALIGKDENSDLENLYSNELHVTQQSAKTFIALSDDDRAVLPKNSIMYYNALKENNISAELHIYPSGGHGWGWKKEFKYREEFLSSLKRWLKEN